MIYPDWRAFLPRREELRRAGLKLVFTNGCYDLLHPGHLRTLATARSFGDALLVAINADAEVRASKGRSRPIIPGQERAEVLDALEFVDFVTFFDDPTPLTLITALLPDVLVKGADWGPGAVVGEPEVLAAGGRVERIPLAPGYSTTALIARARQTAGR
ncbi:MAG: D-glycero-beta-D-manno-heptose 1-phosphate adenylyltransferase [Acidobacteria bacterium]|nr:MAG: D-glycero-beta-D-manno-heptose 1-phosphate adenylyltransferase [Acidobacteriota bacterium]